MSVGNATFRQVFKFTKSGAGWKVVYYSLDEARDSVEATSAVLDSGRLTVQFPKYFGSSTGATYGGTLAQDGQSLVGTWIEFDGRYPLTVHRVSGKDAWPVTPSPHTARFIQVDTGVKLEVLDWGGSGRPLVFLSGLGGSAHDFDTFAPKFTPRYHVYGITRRGFGASSAPAFTTANYRADRLGDDVLAVMDSLGLRHPVLVGHSLGGEELSSIGSRHPDRVAGLIYLDAAMWYAYYDGSVGELAFDRADLIHQLQRLRPERMTPSELRALIRSLRDTTLPRFEKDLDQSANRLNTISAPTTAPDTTPNASRAIFDGMQEYTHIPVPILAIYAVPLKIYPTPDSDSATQARMWAQIDSMKFAQATAVEHGVPTARVVRIPNSTHYVFRSNEADVLREMNTFLSTVGP